MKHNVQSQWNHAVLVCRKCQKKIKGGGFGPQGDKKLAKALKKQLSVRKGHKSRIGLVEVSCLDVCPKQGVMLVDSRAPDVWRIVRPGADLGALALELEAADQDA